MTIAKAGNCLSLDAVAECLGVQRSFFYKQIASGALRVRKRGCRTVVIKATGLSFEGKPEGRAQ